MKKILLLIVTVLLLAATACKQGNTEPEYSGCGAVNTLDHEKYALKAGGDIRSILINLGIQSSSVTAFKPSQTPPAAYIEQDTIKYLDLNNLDVPCWYDSSCSTIYFYAQDITTLGATKKLYLPQNCYKLFYVGEYLTEIDLSTFDTSRVTDMSYMFYNCKNLTSLNLSNFNTENVTTMFWMFGYCRQLASLDLSSFDTSNVTDMKYMFAICESLSSLNISSFDTSNVESMNYMFYATNMSSFNLSSFNTSNVISMHAMFFDNPALTSINISSFNTSNVSDMGSMFSRCSELVTITASTSFVITDQTTSENMFSDCSKLVGGNGTTYNSEHKDAEYARIDGGPSSSTPGYFTSPTNP